MSKEINDLFSMLNCNNDEKIQKQGIKNGLKVKELYVFIQPIGKNAGKYVWENCARIIEQKSDDEFLPYLFELFEWLQDSNWPGFYIIYRRLKKVRADLIIDSYYVAIKDAILQQEEKEEWLINLIEFAKDKEIYFPKNKTKQEIIKKYIKKYNNIINERKEWNKRIEENYFPIKLEIIDDVSNQNIEEIFYNEYKNTFDKIKDILPDGYKDEIFENLFKYYLHNTKMLLSDKVLNKILDIRLLTLGKVFEKDYKFIQKNLKRCQ